MFKNLSTMATVSLDVLSCSYFSGEKESGRYINGFMVLGQY